MTAQANHLNRKRSCQCCDSHTPSVCFQSSVWVSLPSIMSPSHQNATSCCFSQGILPSRSAVVEMFRRRKKKHRLEISAPKDFQHRVHTSFDVSTGQFVGLPPQWQSVIETLKRPRPLVDPSRITNIELEPRKVRGQI